MGKAFKAFMVTISVLAILELILFAGLGYYYQNDVPKSCRYSVTLQPMDNSTFFSFTTDMGGNATGLASGYAYSDASGGTNIQHVKGSHYDSNSETYYLPSSILPFTITDIDHVGTTHYITISYYNVIYSQIPQGTNVTPIKTYTDIGDKTTNFQVQEIADQQVSNYDVWYTVGWIFGTLLIWVVGGLVAIGIYNLFWDE